MLLRKCHIPPHTASVCKYSHIAVIVLEIFVDDATAVVPSTS